MTSAFIVLDFSDDYKSCHIILSFKKWKAHLLYSKTIFNHMAT